MNRIAFYLHNPSMPNIDYSGVLQSNPGIPGSEYEFLLVSYLLDIRDNNIDSYLFVDFDGQFPHTHCLKTIDLQDCCQQCERMHIDRLIIDIKYLDFKVLDQFADKICIYVWAHNQPSTQLLNILWRKSYISKIINVGYGEMQTYQRHPAYLKSTYIYNIFPFQNIDYYTKQIHFDDNHNVVYMGSLQPANGFHILAYHWIEVLRAVPDAQLYVIGSGKLYDRNAVLGHYGIAPKDYENSFMKYLTDSNGNILPSVHFLGLLADEKYEILGKCKVAVPNPTGIETFCITAIEMQMCGCNITTKDAFAYRDTIANKSYLFKQESELSAYIIKRLMDKRDSYESIYQYITSKFGVEGNIQRWEKELKCTKYTSDFFVVMAYELRWFLYRAYCWTLRKIFKK
ncbi:MAG: glycosyltransferase [Bacteroidales bacterium]|nr:glycosyltransferase [Bacteroidales bacterium]